MPRKITDPYEVLGLDRGATEADVRTAYLRLAKKHHPDKNPGDKASEWIFKEVQRAYETLRDANHVRSAGHERPPPGDRAKRDQRERAERARQRRQSEQTEREEYQRREQQQAQAAGDRWQRARAPHTARGDGGTEPVCDDCGSVARWWTRLPQIVRLSGAWAKWTLTVGVGGFGLSLFLSLALSSLAWLLHLVGLLPAVDGALAGGLVLVIFGLGLGFMIWVMDRPKVCPQCGRVSSGWD